MIKTKALLSSFLLLALISCSNKNTAPTFTPPTLADTVFQSTKIPTSIPLPTAVFPIPSITEIMIEEKQPMLDEWETFSGNEDIQVGEIHDIAFGADDSVWFASMSSGLIKYKDGMWNSFNPGSEYGIREIAVTNENTVYVMAWKLNSDDYSSIWGKFDGHNWIWEKDGTVAFAKINHPKNEINKKLERLPYKPQSAKDFIPDLVIHENSGELLFLCFGLDSSLWYIIQGYGFVHVYKDRTFDFYRNFEYTQSFSTLNALVLDNGTFMFSGFGGIFNFDGKTWNRINYGHAPIFSMKEAPNGEIWFGGVEIYRYNPNN